MKTLATVGLLAESAQPNRIKSRVQYEISPSACKRDTDVDNEATVNTATVETQSITQERQAEPYPVITESTNSKRFLNFKKFMAIFKIPSQRFIDSLITRQCKNAVNESGGLNSDVTDMLKAQERKVELERIERYKTSGM